MANRHKDVLVALSQHSRSIKLLGASSLVVLMLMLTACSGNLTQASIAGADAGLHAQTTNKAAATTYPIKIFFSRAPQSLSNLTAVFPVDRISPTLGVASFAIQLLIAGPTTAEHNAGYFTEINTLFSGGSNCTAPLFIGGPDFTLTLNKKGNVTQVGTATLRFCRATSSNGIGEDARVKADIDATLMQFASIKKVVILNKDGHCFLNASGQDLCLK